MPKTICDTCNSHSYIWSWTEAFDKFGFMDGDAQIETYQVEEALTNADYEVDMTEWGLHNTIITSIRKNGVELIPETAEIGYDDPRDYLPREIVALLDRELPDYIPPSRARIPVIVMVHAGCVTSVYSPDPDVELEVSLVDFDNRDLDGLRELAEQLEGAMELHKPYGTSISRLSQELDHVRSHIEDYLTTADAGQATSKQEDSNPEDEIAIPWHIEDVYALVDDFGLDVRMTDELARNVLQTVKGNHDATIGVNWDVLYYTLMDLIEK